MPFHRRLACKLNYFQSIILMFAAVILIGAALLMLPISAQERTVTPFHEALFTATSAVCVTGLVVRDTASHWSAFGQAVLMVLIQIGGLGVITVGASFSLLSGRRISLSQRGRMQEAMSAPKVGGIVRLTGFVIRASLMIEGIGALCMLPVFCRDFGVSGIWKAVFHSVSAFCNAGFDLMGTPDMPFVSLTAYRADPVINLTISTLIVVGGIGFLTWDDVRTNRLCFHRYRLQSKVILTATALLILLPTLYFFCFEFKGGTLRERLLLSLFQSVTPRTAGFNTADYTSLSSSGRGLTILLMFIGGSSGSTAGGIKTVTFGLLVIAAFRVARGSKDVVVMKRRVDTGMLLRALSITVISLMVICLGAFLIALVDGLTFEDVLFETFSAFGTVGVTTGITTQFSYFGKLLLMAMMFFGRVGILTITYEIMVGLHGEKDPLRRPKAELLIG